MMDRESHSLRVGWRNLFFISSCAVVSVICSGGKQVVVLHTIYVLIVPYSCGVVFSFFGSGGKQFQMFRTYGTYCTIQMCGCVSFWFQREIHSFTLHPSLSPYRCRNKYTRFALAGETFFPVVLYDVSVFSSGGKKVSI